MYILAAKQELCFQDIKHKLVGERNEDNNLEHRLAQV